MNLNEESAIVLKEKGSIRWLESVPHAGTGSAHWNILWIYFPFNAFDLNTLQGNIGHLTALDP